MRKPKKVALDQLVFTMSWEDPELDRAAFASAPGAELATVGSGGCNALTFLLDDPARVLAFDYNPTQVWLLELKVGALRALRHAELLELLGVRPSRRREQLLSRALATVPRACRAFWEREHWVIARGLLGGGRYERFVGRFNLLLRALHGRRKLEALFQERDREGRERFYRGEWDGRLWRALFTAFFNKTVLGRFGLSSDYFHFDDGSGSFAESFARRTTRALIELPVRDNPFMAQYVLGRYLDEEHLPEYLRAENFDFIRDRLDRLEVVRGDVRDLFADLDAGSFDGVCLSNVFELMSQGEADAALRGVARTIKPGGRLTLRNLMIPRGVPEALAEQLVAQRELARALHEQDRSFVYRSFQVYSRSPSDGSPAAARPASGG